MNENSNIQQIINEVISIHKELSEDTHAIGVHRKELGARVDSINKRYLYLFEEVMSELLSMQRNKFNVMADELEKMRSAAEELLDQLLQLKDENALLEVQLKEITEQNENLLSLNRARELEINMLHQRVSDLEKIEKDYIDSLEQLRRDRERETLERAALEERLRIGDQMMIDRMLNELREQMLREQEMILDVEKRKYIKLQNEYEQLQVKYNELVVQYTKTISSNSTQTVRPSSATY